MDRTKFITKEDLDTNPNWVFVFGDNTIRKGYGGAAALRDHPQAYGFITKKFPDNDDSSFYTPQEYMGIPFMREQLNLERLIQAHPAKTFIISKLGSGLANRFKIYEAVIQPWLVELAGMYKNVVLLEV